MTTVRRVKADHKPYTRILNSLLQNIHLSWAAKGLLTYLLSLPDDWIVQVGYIAKTFGQFDAKGSAKRGQGEDALYALFRELRDHGHASYKETRVHGRVVSGEWCVYEEPLALEDRDKQKQTPPQPAEPVPAKPDPVKPGFTNKEEELTNKEEKEREGKAPAAPPSPSKRKSPDLTKIERAEAVTLTDEQHQKLISKHGEIITELCYEKLSLHKLAADVTYASDYHAILKWVVSAVQNDQKRAQIADRGGCGTYVPAKNNTRPEPDSDHFARHFARFE